jgi:uncharacterized membrane protein YgcG
LSGFCSYILLLVSVDVSFLDHCVIVAVCLLCVCLCVCVCVCLFFSGNFTNQKVTNILNSARDAYLLNPCEADKWIVIELCQEIGVDILQLANFEFFSSTFRHFQLYGHRHFPNTLSPEDPDWHLIGSFSARNVRTTQTFAIPNAPAWHKYLLLRFHTHFGGTRKFYCPLSVVEVYGSTLVDELKQHLELNAHELQLVEQLDSSDRPVIDAPPPQASSREGNALLSIVSTDPGADGRVRTPAAAERGRGDAEAGGDAEEKAAERLEIEVDATGGGALRPNSSGGGGGGGGGGGSGHHHNGDALLLSGSGRSAATGEGEGEGSTERRAGGGAEASSGEELLPPPLASTESSSGGGAAGGNDAGGSAPRSIFATLAQNIKSLQMNQSLAHKWLEEFHQSSKSKFSNVTSEIKRQEQQFARRFTQLTELVYAFTNQTVGLGCGCVSVCVWCVDVVFGVLYVCVCVCVCFVSAVVCVCV